ncbi:protein TolR [Desulfoluna limicola]|uniref:Protein TolR n=1 Tax=Desulfoluna limicola TaxID=2810562 RepID=A0ABN6F729_9BACT|nr:protein TolR [Desulfoluna limicola]BCS97337.1 protein TolR [Desulfoluna limicola]
MISGGDDNRLMSEINVTPFVDVMLVLLIIFMVAAPMMTQGVDVSLPEASGGSLARDDNEPFYVTLKSEGGIFINDFPVDEDRLRPKLAALLKERPGTRVFLRADKSISYGTVVRIMAEIKGSGVEKLGMVTEPLETK